MQVVTIVETMGRAWLAMEVRPLFYTGLVPLPPKTHGGNGCLNGHFKRGLDSGMS